MALEQARSRWGIRDAMQLANLPRRKKKLLRSVNS